MDTLLKASIITLIVVAILIGLPILVLLIGVAWPLLVVIALIFFVPILIAFLIGKNSKGKED